MSDESKIPSRAKRPKYQGHKDWNHWNVSLWINNDEGLYLCALNYARYGRRTKDQAARDMLADLNRHGLTKTPDGAPYSVSSIRAAMAGM